MPIKRTKYCGYKPCHKPIKVGQFCSSACGIKHTAEKGKRLTPKTPKWIERKTNGVKFLQVTSKITFGTKKQKPIRKVSKKRAERLRIYTLQRASFLKNKICPISGRPATEIHHTKGRDNDMLNDIRYWLAVTRQGHIWIHENPVEAEAKGYLIKRSTKNK